MNRVIRVVSLVALLSGVVLIAAPSSLTADTCSGGDGSKCICPGTCSAGPAECHCHPPDY